MARSAKKTPDFESAVAELEEIVRLMESGELGLEAALEQYQRGVALVRQCRGALDSAEQRIRQLHEGEMKEFIDPSAAND